MLEPEVIRPPQPNIVTPAKTMGEVFLKRVELSRDKRAFLTKHNDTWITHTWQNFYDRSATVATHCIRQGLQVGDKICMIGRTRQEWAICDVAGLLAGAVTVGAYPTLQPKQLAYLLAHSDTRFVFAQGASEAAKLLEIRDDIPKVERVYIWEMDELPAAVKNNEWFADYNAMEQTRDIDAEAILQRQKAIDPAETAIIVYTSGTTGPPKGAMITHHNILTLLRDSQSLLPFSEEDCTLSFLPMAHVAERILSFYGRIATGVGTAFATNFRSVLNEVQEIRPTLFGAVPRIFEKAYAKILQRVANMNPRRQKIFRWAEAVGRRVVRHWQAHERVPLGLYLQYRLADRLVFSKLRDVFGGRVQHFMTGAAPIAPEILEFFWAAGFPIYELYGMTESTVVSHVNERGSIKLGTVGRALPFVEQRIAEDGEILIRGKTVFKGYYKNPEATAEAIDKEGWLHTGDIGTLDAQGFLSIIDRKKHIIITAGGKNLTPANIENDIKAQDPMISQVHVHGDRRPYLTALIALHTVEAIEWALEQNVLSNTDTAEQILDTLANDPTAQPEGIQEIISQVIASETIQKQIVTAVQRANAALARVETIKRIRLLDRELSVQEDELTPTLKVKRKAVELKFADFFDALYKDESSCLVVIDEHEQTNVPLTQETKKRRAP